MDDLAALDRAGAELRARLAVLEPDQLPLPSVLPGWTVYDLVNHVIGGALRYRLMLDGADQATMAATRTQDHVGADPVSSYGDLSAPLRERFRQPGALEQVVQHPAGRRTGLELLRMRNTDVALHAVDLARSIDADDRLAPDLVDYLLAACAPMFDAGRAAGFFGVARDVGPDADPQERLLALAGR